MNSTDRSFVIEAVMLAAYGELLVPSREVTYFVPYSSIGELYELLECGDPIMPDEDDDAYVKERIKEFIAFLEEPFNAKKLERALAMPWRQSPPLLLNDKTRLVVVSAMDNGEYGENFDPIETELLLLSLRNHTPLLTDQFELIEKVIEAAIPVQVVDLEDFEFALEEGLPDL
ncbi:hypothetical protein [Paenibacillus senegalensis]|uniref:hypothetical protein n=1 Tax=Paenibacillus senegalensis TaxID=1465766 RepID=UPI000289E72B|nr:hypothetical protein [Paenibacillus senegalensis]